MSTAVASSSGPSTSAVAGAAGSSVDRLDDRQSTKRDVRMSNITAAKALADAVRSSLGPYGMDKLIVEADGSFLVSNDGATILSKLNVMHPVCKMLVELSRAQDVEAGDGTTSVVVIAGSLLSACEDLLEKGIHASVVSEAFQMAMNKAEEVLERMSKGVDLVKERDLLVRCANTSLQSKTISQFSELFSNIAVDAVVKVAETGNADLKRVRIVKQQGADVRQSELVHGLVAPQGASHMGGPTRVENAKIGLIQFCLSNPKPNMDNKIVAQSNEDMDRTIKGSREYVRKLVMAIKKTGCNVLFVQKSILKDALDPNALDLLGKAKIMVVPNVERDDMEFFSESLNCDPVADITLFSQDKLVSADLVEESRVGGNKVIKVTGLHTTEAPKTVSVLIRGPDATFLDEADRSLHDALCVVRSLFKKPRLIVGGGAPEMEVSHRLMEYASSLQGVEAYCIKAFAAALEIVPYTLAENAALDAVKLVSALRQAHAEGSQNAGINMRLGCVSDLSSENVVQPLLVSLSAIKLATEFVRTILKIDGIVNVA